ncbi:hypothetical protein GLYMA_06G034450v4 [Glycine max]|nr:hypothetical protein GLYMA_06G034450v4 [Glycine max]KAH1124008.1 hypothetical protein GYH30_013969 [Glycine max]
MSSTPHSPLRSCLLLVLRFLPLTLSPPSSSFCVTEGCRFSGCSTTPSF